MQKINIINVSKRELTGKRFTISYNLKENEGYLLYVISGRGTVNINGKRSRFNDNTFLLCKGNDSISYQFSKDDSGELYFVFFSVPEGERFTENRGLENRVYNCFMPKVVTKMFTRLTREFIIRFTHNEETLCCLFHELIYTVALSSEKSSNVTTEIYRLAEDIHNNFMLGEFDVNEYAAAANMSKDRFSVLFKQHFGYPPYKYQIVLKMNEAVALLTHTNLPINRISDMLGFSNQLYFSNAFKKHTGMSPTEARNQK